MALPTDRKLIEEIRADLFRQTVNLYYHNPFVYRDPKKLADKIRDDVGKLKSCSVAGRRVIQEERCARAGITVDGEPCFFIDRTK